ncbi:hypothetical protein CEXT_364221 [Caerostris extrusa]|uniref:Uncharacterized protein n=1 Tax=Caerostris extrusa TaxID=172846 RepID=A0AAV4X3R3_CAEEX|nr:hypothetical protein CEXT_364221 [Caerostris extrusa]
MLPTAGPIQWSLPDSRYIPETGLDFNFGRKVLTDRETHFVMIIRTGTVRFSPSIPFPYLPLCPPLIANHTHRTAAGFGMESKGGVVIKTEFHSRSGIV